MSFAHQPGEAVFRSILPEDIDWRPFPAFPPSARLAVLVGEPTEAGPYVIRVKVPSGVKLMPHRHPEDRIYTVMSGVFYIGLGDRFGGDKVQAFPPGSVIVLPGNTPPFHWAKSGEYVTQVTAIGRSASNISIRPTIRASRAGRPRLTAMGHTEDQSEMGDRRSHVIRSWRRRTTSSRRTGRGERRTLAALGHVRSRDV